jgi:hypothetical protein
MSEDEVWNEVMRGGDDAGEAIKDQINEKWLIMYGHVRWTENTARRIRHWSGGRGVGQSKGVRSRRIWGGDADLIRQ